jgi:hypothetical protein
MSNGSAPAIGAGPDPRGTDASQGEAGPRQQRHLATSTLVLDTVSARCGLSAGAAVAGCVHHGPAAAQFLGGALGCCTASGMAVPPT